MQSDYAKFRQIVVLRRWVELLHSPFSWPLRDTIKPNFVSWKWIRNHSDLCCANSMSIRKDCKLRLHRLSSFHSQSSIFASSYSMVFHKYLAVLDRLGCQIPSASNQPWNKLDHIAATAKELAAHVEQIFQFNETHKLNSKAKDDLEIIRDPACLYWYVSLSTYNIVTDISCMYVQKDTYTYWHHTDMFVLDRYMSVSNTDKTECACICLNVHVCDFYRNSIVFVLSLYDICILLVSCLYFSAPYCIFQWSSQISEC